MDQLASWRAASWRAVEGIVLYPSHFHSSVMRILIAIACIDAAFAFVGPSIASNNNQISSRVSRMMPVLHMNLFDRFTRVAKATLNDVLKSVEDPEKIMNQALEDMQVRGMICLLVLMFLSQLTYLSRETWSRSVNRTPKSLPRNVA